MDSMNVEHSLAVWNEIDVGDVDTSKMIMRYTRECEDLRRTQHSKRKVLQKCLILVFLVDGAREGIALNVIPELPMQKELCSAQH